MRGIWEKNRLCPWNVADLEKDFDVKCVKKVRINVDFLQPGCSKCAGRRLW